MRGGNVVKKKKDEMKTVRALTALLSDENKKSVIAVAKALQFTQSNRETDVERSESAKRLG